AVARGATARPDGGTPRPGRGRRIGVLGLVLLAAVMAVVASQAVRDVIRPEPGRGDARTPAADGPATTAAPPPADPDATAADVAATTAAAVGRGDLDEDTAEKLTEHADQAVVRHRAGEVRKASDELDELRKELGKAAEEGEVAAPAHNAISAAADRLEAAMAATAPGDQPERRDDGDEDD
ncbi:MAG TPA: hypothetical protein VHF25_06640, partial [Nitriliruptorales bacterium]|nr:hypothetical protein [Nitriliruptorales bacterium]